MNLDYIIIPLFRTEFVPFLLRIEHSIQYEMSIPVLLGIKSETDIDYGRNKFFNASLNTKFYSHALYTRFRKRVTRIYGLLMHA